MGNGIIKRKNAVKKMYLAQAVKELERLEKENYELKNDPQSVIGQFVGQYQELYGQNSRLSVLCAALIQRLDGSVKLTKEEMEAFKDNRINIKWELPEGVTKPEEAESFVFTFELEPAKTAPTLHEIPPTEIPGPSFTEALEAAGFEPVVTNEPLTAQEGFTTDDTLVIGNPGL